MHIHTGYYTIDNILHGGIMYHIHIQVFEVRM